MADTSYEGFELGTPALVCRWRLAGGSLPLENRHLRALSARQVAGRPVADELIAWAKQHVEWTLADGAAAAGEPDGVLMVVLDDAGRAAMSVGPYEAPADRGLDALATRALTARDEAAQTGVAPETLWAWRDGGLAVGLEEGSVASGATSLVFDLATTLKIAVRYESRLDALVDGADEALLVSDEHGVVAADGRGGEHAQRLADAYARLLERARTN